MINQLWGTICLSSSQGQTFKTSENRIGTDCREYSQSLDHAVSLRRSRSHQEHANVDNPSSRHWVSVGFLFQSVELNSEQRPPIDLFKFQEIKVRAGQEPDLPTIAMCSWCQKVRHEPTGGSRWLEAEDYYAAGGRSRVRISHSICDECFDKVSQS